MNAAKNLKEQRRFENLLNCREIPVFFAFFKLNYLVVNIVHTIQKLLCIYFIKRSRNTGVYFPEKSFPPPLLKIIVFFR